MAFKDYTILGGYKGFFKGKDPSVDYYSWLSPAQQQVERSLGDFLNSRIGQGLPGFEKPLSAGMSPYEAASLNSLSQYLQQDPSSTIDATGSALTRALSGQPAYNIDPAATEDFIQNALYRPARREFDTRTLPGIRESFAGAPSNFYTSARAQAENQARGDMETQLASKASDIRYQDEQARRSSLTDAANRSIMAMGYAPSVNDMGESFYSRQAQVAQTLGALPRMLEQQALDRELQEFIRTTAENNPILQQALSYIGTRTGDLGVKPGKPSLFEQFAPAIGGALTGAAGMPSLGGAGRPGGVSGPMMANGNFTSGGAGGLSQALAIIGPMLMAGCLPPDAQIEMADGTTRFVVDIETGDRVRGGVVIATTSRPRPEGHRFWKHLRKDGAYVIASLDHPFEDTVKPVRSMPHFTSYTYDILTTSGVYYIDGVATRSTIPQEEPNAV